VALALLSASLPAAAQPRDEVAAEALFLDGRRLMETKSWAAAAEKFSASDRAAPSVGARLSLGDCHRELGKTASAWAAYRAAANLARRTQDLRRAENAEKRAQELEPKLIYVVIEVPETARVPGIEIEWNGGPKAAALWGQRFPVDPGEHTASARAPGHREWSQTVDASSDGVQLVVTVPRLSPTGGEAQPAPRPEPQPVISPAAEQSAAESTSPFTTGRKAAVGVAAFGVAGVVAGSVFGLSARSKWNEAENEHCNDRLECNDEGVALADDAGGAADLATISFVVGGAAIAGAVALWFLAGPADGAALAPIAGPDLVGVAASGRF
jgi:hypothetical protein